MQQNGRTIADGQVAVCTGPTGSGAASSVFVAELGSDVSFQRGAGPTELDSFVPNLGHRIVQYDCSADAPFDMLRCPPDRPPPVLL